MLDNRLPVTEQGVTIPKAWFGDAKEVALKRKNGHLVVEALTAGNGVNEQANGWSKEDPLRQLCENPSALEITDASVNLDKYLYGAP